MSQVTPRRSASASARSSVSCACPSCAERCCWYHGSPSSGTPWRTVTNVTSAPTSAASSTPSSTAAHAFADPSVAITIRFIGCSPFRLNSRTCEAGAIVGRRNAGSGICRRPFRAGRMPRGTPAPTLPGWPWLPPRSVTSSSATAPRCVCDRRGGTTFALLVEFFAATLRAERLAALSRLPRGRAARRSNRSSSPTGTTRRR